MTHEFDWHRDPIDRQTPLTDSYRHTQNVRRFLKRECGPDFHFSRDLMAWIKEGHPKTMGDIADEWHRRRG